MQQSKTLPMWDELKSLNNVPASENNFESSKLITREPLEGTPFTLVQIENDPWFIAVGKYRIPNTTKSKEELIEHVMNTNWELIIPVLTSLLDMMDLKIEMNKITEQIPSI